MTDIDRDRDIVFRAVFRTFKGFFSSPLQAAYTIGMVFIIYMVNKQLGIHACLLMTSVLVAVRHEAMLNKVRFEYLTAVIEQQGFTKDAILQSKDGDVVITQDLYEKNPEMWMRMLSEKSETLRVVRVRLYADGK